MEGMANQSLTLSVILCYACKQDNCPLRGSTQQPMGTDAETHSQTLDGAWGVLWKSWRKGMRDPKRIGIPQEDQHSQLEQGLTLTVDPGPLTRLTCLASVGKDVPSPA